MAAPIDKRLLQRATATRKFLVAVVVTGVAMAGLVIAQAWFISHGVASVFDRSQAGEPAIPDNFTTIVVGLLLVFAGRSLLTWLNSWLGHKASAQVKSTLRRDIMAARLSRPADASTPSSTLITLVTQGLDKLDGYFSKFLPQLVMAVVVPLLIGGIVATIDWKSALIMFLTLPLIPLFMALIGYRTEAQVRKSFKSQTRLANHFSDLVGGLPTLQVFGRAKAQHKGLTITEEKNRKETMGTLTIAFLSSGVLELLATLSVAIVAVTIGFRVVEWNMDLTTSLFILVLAPEFYLPMRQVGTHFHDSADGLAAVEQAFAFIEGAEARSLKGSTPPPDLATAEIIFDDVELHYPDAKRPSLTAFNATIRPGEITALVGPSGGGKSTALAILMGFEAPTAGTVQVGDVDLTELDVASLRRQIAWVGQEPGMVWGTIADNLRLGAPDATDADLRLALDQAGGEFLALDRQVGDESEGLSAGERRRVALARALLRIRFGGAKLLVLDEPTAGLDQATEAAAVAAVRDSGAGAVVVTHREALMKLADEMITVRPAAQEVTA